MISFSPHDIYRCSRLVLFGENLIPDIIDNKCEKKSTSCYKKGDLISKASENQSFRKSGMWSIKHIGVTESFSNDLDYFINLFPKSFMPLIGHDGIEQVRLCIWLDEGYAIRDSRRYIPSSFELGFDLESLDKIRYLQAEINLTYFKIDDDL